MALPISLYSNVSPIRPPEGGRVVPIAARKAAAAAERDSEAHIKAKVEQANELLDRLEARVQCFADHLKLVQKRKARTLAQIERIEDGVLAYMDAAGLKTLAGLRCSMRLQPAAESLEVIDESLIPREFMRQPKPPASAPDKVAIKAALAQDGELDPAAWGCRLSSKISLIRK